MGCALVLCACSSGTSEPLRPVPEDETPPEPGEPPPAPVPAPAPPSPAWSPPAPVSLPSLSAQEAAQHAKREALYAALAGVYAVDRERARAAAGDACVEAPADYVFEHVSPMIRALEGVRSELRSAALAAADVAATIRDCDRVAFEGDPDPAERCLERAVASVDLVRRAALERTVTPALAAYARCLDARFDAEMAWRSALDAVWARRAEVEHDMVGEDPSLEASFVSDDIEACAADRSRCRSGEEGLARVLGSAEAARLFRSITGARDDAALDTAVDAVLDALREAAERDAREHEEASLAQDDLADTIHTLGTEIAASLAGGDVAESRRTAETLRAKPEADLEVGPRPFEAAAEAARLCGAGDGPGSVLATTVVAGGETHRAWVDVRPDAPELSWQRDGASSGAVRVHRTRGEVVALSGAPHHGGVALAWCSIVDGRRVVYGAIAFDRDGQRHGRVAQLGATPLDTDARAPCAIALASRDDAMVVARTGGECDARGRCRGLRLQQVVADEVTDFAIVHVDDAASLHGVTVTGDRIELAIGARRCEATRATDRAADLTTTPVPMVCRPGSRTPAR